MSHWTLHISLHISSIHQLQTAGSGQYKILGTGQAVVSFLSSLRASSTQRMFARQ